MSGGLDVLAITVSNVSFYFLGIFLLRFDNFMSGLFLFGLVEKFHTEIHWSVEVFEGFLRPFC
jgi:hypothetical protein